jgi:serine/threonine protein kinase
MQGRLPEKEARTIFVQLVNALIAVHDQGVIHRNLKVGHHPWMVVVASVIRIIMTPSASPYRSYCNESISRSRP